MTLSDKSGKVNVGFIGAGNLTSRQHLPNAHACPWMRVHTICDLNPQVLEKRAKEYPSARRITDYHQLLADPEVDMVVIAMNPRWHVPLAVEALRAGKHVYVEKPLSEEIEPSLEAERVCRETGKHLAVGFNRRFAPSYRDAFEIIRDDAGPIMMAYRMVDDDRDRPVRWQGRNRLVDECCHVFDVFNWFARSRPVRIYATEAGRPNDNHVIVEYENGISASLYASSYGTFHWPKERFEIVGDHKVVAVEDFVELQVAGAPGWKDKRYRGREYEGYTRGYAQMYAELGVAVYRQLRSSAADLLYQSGLIDSAPDEDKWVALAEKYPEHFHIPINYSVDKGWADALAGFARALLEGRTPLNATARDGAVTVAMSLAAVKSIQNRAPVTLAEDYPWLAQ